MIDASKGERGMSIIDVIDNANKEYLTNGRSADFVAMEDNVISSQKMVQIYWFARYVQGADIDKLQSVILKNGTLEDGFYFVKYVKGSDIQLFLQKAIDKGSKFWMHKIVSLAISPFNTRKEDIMGLGSQLIEFGIDLDRSQEINKHSKKSRTVKGHINEDIDRIIEKARSTTDPKKFDQLQKDAMYTAGNGADALLFAKHVPGANINDIQRSLILHGNAFNMRLFAEHIKGASPVKILTGMELAQRDYVAIETKEIKKMERIANRQRALKTAIAAGKSNREIYNLRAELREAECIETYLTEVNRHKRKIESLISDSYGQK